MIDLGQERCCIVIAEMSVLTGDTLLQKSRISSVCEHFSIVVGFQDKVVRLFDVLTDGWSDMSDIGDEAKVLIFYLNGITYIIRTVVRDGKGRDHKVLDVKRLLLIDIMNIRSRQLFCHTITFVDTFVYFGSGIDRKKTFLAQCADSLDMVGMVVRHKDCTKHVESNTVVLQAFLNGSNA